MKKLILTLSAVCLVAPAMAEDKKLELTGNDQMQYSTKELTVTAGEKVALTFKHTGAIAKMAMGHNVVILKAGTPVVPFATKASQAGPTADYIPADEESKKLIVAHTKLIGGGESDTLNFTAPTEPGDYPYVCTFPGHFVQMQGILKVKAKE